MAAQPELGLWPKRWLGAYTGHCDHLVLVRKDLKAWWLHSLQVNTLWRYGGETAQNDRTPIFSTNLHFANADTHAGSNGGLLHRG